MCSVMMRMRLEKEFSAEELAKKTFKDLRGTFTEEQMKIETSRCLGCGAAGNAPAAVAKLVTKKIARK